MNLHEGLLKTFKNSTPRPAEQMEVYEAAAFCKHKAAGAST